MQSSLMRILSFVVLAIVIASCANRGRPSGGEIDKEPPVIISESPANFSTNFNADEIRVYFNEYIKIEDIRKQLIISPPMDTDPLIVPMGGASKYISIKIKDTLQDNTTYAFNFGQSIVDNNEGNPYPYYRYVFSTGDTIDSLSVKGYVEDALLEKPDTFVSVMLYEVDTSYTDSIIYKEKPKYITNTLDSVTTFSLKNIKAGTYKLMALKDENGNNKFDQRNDKIAFMEGFITVPTDSIYPLTLFKETSNFKAIKPKQTIANKILFPYQGNYESMQIKVLGDTPQGYKTRITKDPEKDSLYYWYKPNFERDTTLFIVTNEKSIDTFNHRFKNSEPDSLVMKVTSSRNLNFNSHFTIEGNIPLTKIDKSKITLINKDSVAVDFEVEYDSILNRYKLPIKKEEGQKYYIKMLPNTFTDFYNGTNKDTLDYVIRTKMKSDYGNLRVNIRNAKFPLIVQLVNNKGDVIYQRYTKDKPVVDFTDLMPNLYSLRVIFDSNENGEYDTGNFLLGTQPERVSYSKPIEEIRASFDFVIDFTLLD